jgi:hypothetical protein
MERMLMNLHIVVSTTVLLGQGQKDKKHLLSTTHIKTSQKLAKAQENHFNFYLTTFAKRNVFVIK